MNSRNQVKKQKTALQFSLQQLVAREELNLGLGPSHTVGRTSCLILVDAVDSFLTSWEALDDPSDLPRSLLMETFSAIIEELGPGHSHFRESILKMLVSTVSTAKGRQVLLDVLPATLSVGQGEEASAQVLRALRQVLVEDSSALFPVLDCLSTLSLAGEGEHESFRIALDYLPLVPEHDLCRLLKRLFRSVSNEEDARDVILALRSELRAVEETNRLQESETVADDDLTKENGDSTTAPLTVTEDINDVESPSKTIASKSSDMTADLLADVLQVVLVAVVDADMDSLIREAYMHVLDSELKEVVEQTNSNDDSGSSKDDTFLLCDLAVLLILLERPSDTESAQTILDSLVGLSIFPFDKLSRLMRLATDTNNSEFSDLCGQSPGEASSILYLLLIPSFMTMCVRLLQAQDRIPRLVAPVRILEPTQDFSLEFLRRIDREQQTKLLRRLLDLSEDRTTVPGEDEDRPIVLRTGLRNRQRNGKENVDSTINAIYGILSVLVKEEKGIMAPFKHVFLARLASSGAGSTFNYIPVKNMSFILSLLVDVQPEAAMNTRASAPEVLMTHRLLFSPPFPPHLKGRKSSGRMVGLIFAGELVRSSGLSPKDRKDIEEWVRRILLPASRSVVDPETGSYGLHFLRSLRDANDRHDAGDAISLSLDKQVFQTMKMVLANTGLVQEATFYQQRKKRKSALGYTRRLPCFSLDTNNQKFRSIVFSLSLLIRDRSMLHPTGWSNASQWVFGLVDTYLEMGRRASAGSKSKGRKWIPHGWLEAAIEFPTVDLSMLKASNQKQKSALAWMHTQLCKYELHVENLLVPECTEKDLRDLLAQLKRGEDFTKFLQSMLRFAFSLILGLGLSAAVLKNTFDHYQDYMNDTPDEKLRHDKSQYLRLIQYQLIKIYDMKRKCMSVELVFRAMNVASRRTKQTIGKGKKSKARVEPTNTEDDQQKQSEIDLASEQLTTILSAYFETSTFINSDILWACLVDPIHDNLIVESLDAKSKGVSFARDKSKGTELRFVIDMKRGILDHLIAMLQHGNTIEALHILDPTLLNDENSVVVRYSHASQCLRLCAYLSLNLPRERRRNTSEMADVSILSTLSILTAAYFQLVFAVMVRCSKPSSDLASADVLSGQKPIVSKDFMNLCSTILGSDEPLEEELDGEGLPSDVDRLDEVFNAFVFHLRICDDAAVSNELVESLSVLAVLGKGDLLFRMTDVSWTALHTTYFSQEDAVRSRTPFALVEILRRSMPSSGLCTKQASSAQRTLTTTIMKTALNRSRDFEKSSTFINGILRHWALLALYPQSYIKKESHLSNMCDSLERFLDDIYETLAVDISTKMKDETSDEDGEYYPPQWKRKSRPSLPASDIPGLNGLSFPIYCEVLLHSIVAALSISSPTMIAINNTSNDESLTAEAGPFLHLQNIAELFGSVIALFRTKMKIFPRRTVPMVIHASKCMLNVCLYQLHCCVEWRNSQPMLSMEEIEAGFEDEASIRYLHSLLESFGTHIVGELLSLCNLVDFQSSGEDDSDVPTQGGGGDQQKTSGFRFAVDKSLQALKKVAAAHNLNSLQMGLLSDDKDPETAKKKQVVRVKGFHEIEPPTRTARGSSKRENHLVSSNEMDLEQLPPAKKARRTLHFNEDGEKADDAASMGDDSESSGSFGASGNWGEGAGDDEYFTLQSPSIMRKM